MNCKEIFQIYIYWKECWRWDECVRFQHWVKAEEKEETDWQAISDSEHWKRKKTAFSNNWSDNIITDRENKMLCLWIRSWLLCLLLSVLQQSFWLIYTEDVSVAACWTESQERHWSGRRSQTASKVNE